MRSWFPAFSIAISIVISNAPDATASMSSIGPPSTNADPTTQHVAYLHPWKTIEVETFSGRLAKIRSYIHTCGDDGRPAVSATANHGTVTFKDGMANACGRIRPVTEIWYQSEPGFRGVDQITVGAPFYEGIDVTVK